MRLTRVGWLLIAVYAAIALALIGYGIHTHQANPLYSGLSGNVIIAVLIFTLFTLHTFWFHRRPGNQAS